MDRHAEGPHARYGAHHCVDRLRVNGGWIYIIYQKGYSDRRPIFVPD